MKRIGLKYCGGCNPVYDRETYMARVRKAAAGRIQWVTLEEGGFTTLLAVNGCERSCIQKEMSKQTGAGRIVSIKDDGKPPEEIVSLLLAQGEEP